MLYSQFEQNGNPVVQYFTAKNFTLKSGRTIPEARLGFCVYGKTHHPVIVIHPGVAGSPKAHVVQEEAYAEGWWSSRIGPGKLLDTNRFQIVCFGHFGGNGPSSTADELSAYLQDLNILDTSWLASLALKENGITSIHAAIGTSMGAAMAREWLFQNHVGVGKVVEIFGKYGNNHYGSPAVCSHKIHYDILVTKGDDLDDIRRRFVECFGPMRAETRAFSVVYDYVLARFDALYDQLSNKAALSVARMAGYFRFVTPLYFQQKWDAIFSRTLDTHQADAEMRRMMDHLAESFAATFQRTSYASLRFMDAQPNLLSPLVVADALMEKNADLMTVVVRGDRLYNPDLQIDEHCRIRDQLPAARKKQLKLHICHNELRGHDHFLSEEFDCDAEVIGEFLCDGLESMKAAMFSYKVG